MSRAGFSGTAFFLFVHAAAAVTGEAEKKNAPSPGCVGGRSILCLCRPCGRVVLFCYYQIVVFLSFLHQQVFAV